jgi:hypothetical protein
MTAAISSGRPIRPSGLRVSSACWSGVMRVVAEERRVDGAGGDGVHEDAGRQFPRPGPGERQDRALGRGIGRGAFAPEVGEFRGDVDDAPACGNPRQRRLRHDERAAKVYRHLPVEVRKRHGGERTFDQDSGVVHQHVDAGHFRERQRRRTQGRSRPPSGRRRRGPAPAPRTRPPSDAAQVAAPIPRAAPVTTATLTKALPPGRCRASGR